METQRKPYYVIRAAYSCLKMREGIGKEAYPHNGNAIQLYLTDEEVQKYNQEAARRIIRPYTEITLKRIFNMPVELILYAISEVLYENTKEESNQGGPESNFQKVEGLENL